MVKMTAQQNKLMRGLMNRARPDITRLNELAAYQFALPKGMLAIKNMHEKQSS
jgi:hypothetical protein